MIDIEGRRVPRGQFDPMPEPNGQPGLAAGIAALFLQALADKSLQWTARSAAWCSGGLPSGTRTCYAVLQRGAIP